MDSGLDPLTPPPPSPQRVASRMGAGVILIVVGALFFADRLGWDWWWVRWGFHPTFARMWPVFFIVVGLLKIFSPQPATTITVTDGTGSQTRVRSGRARRGEWMLVVGILLLLHQNNWLSIERSWPLFIVAAGLSLLFGRSGRQWRRI